MKYFPMHTCTQSLQSCLTLWDPVDCCPPGSSVHGILQACVLEWVAMPSSRGSSQPRDQTRIFYVPCIGRQVLYHECQLGSPYFPTIDYYSVMKWKEPLSHERTQGNFKCIFLSGRSQSKKTPAPHCGAQLCPALCGPVDCRPQAPLSAEFCT